MDRREFLALGAGLAAAGPVCAAAPADVIDLTWHDPARARDLPVRLRVPAGSGEAPLILFSHGLGGSRAGGTRWGEHWAANGFFCVHLQHPGSDESVWKDKSPFAGIAGLRGAMTAENGLARLADVRFAIAECVRRRAAGETPFARIDVSRIGMSGHSFGARTTLAVAALAEDARVKAAIALSPVGERGEAANRARAGRVRMPFLSITGTEDRVPLVDDISPAERRLPFAFMPAPDKYLLVLDGADHMVFNGEPDARRWSEANRTVHAPLVETVSLAFWRAHLLGDAPALAWLRGPEPARLAAAGEWQLK